MRGLLLFLIAGVVLVVAAIGINTGIFAYRRDGLNVSCKGFVDRTVSTMAANWNGQILLEQRDARIPRRLRRDDLAALSDGFSQLGRFWDYHGATGGVDMSYVPFFGGPLTASYVAKAGYAGGLATFHLQLVQHNGRWLIADFHVDVDLLDHVPSGS